MKRLLPALLMISAIMLASGCSGTGTEDSPASTDGEEASALTGGWSSPGNGVAYRSTGAGDGVFIGYAGYSVSLANSVAWVGALSATRLEALHVGHLYAVRGPSDAGYNNKDIANTHLASHLVGVDGPGHAAPFVLVGAHSSGTMVAHELFGQVIEGAGDPKHVLEGKIVYANLDGGQSGLNARILSSLKRIEFVWAEDTTLSHGRSTNSGGMEALGQEHGGSGLRLVVDRSGCHSGAKWCLHDLLITTRPHNPDTFDLVRDYTDFVGRPVQDKWIRAVESSLR